ncbi:hypothetical protein GLAREA_10045 [Glarea lozoyensis ATCC 20868]|uniref:Transcription activator gloB n=1 Tax=Glarea lozoyensis (strain ATCC 20868 / MF5171) TaxID=1116229 RepID=GLOB_GLAL2|nr:uncharacterized protein GLAREA_10045 [Glarea lozoyensis ATCC 20868]S3DQQ3.1 RecName: Full=Pneumocandin biosynthesis cluster protein B [Glarea lozoyensis ATCC 20868]EPE34351.1 hypothetical protein GLAREA_10045 [Glarea lozoyensis ATCC 20868]
MDLFQSPGGDLIQDEDSVEVIEMLCIDFRDRLLVALSTTCQSDFREAKKVVEERLRDILETASSLSSTEVTSSPNASPLYNTDAPEDVVPTVGLDVGLDEPMADYSQNTPSITGGTASAEYQNSGDTNQMTLEDPACVDMFAAESQNTGHIPDSCLRDWSFEGVSMKSPSLFDWSSRNSNFPLTQEHENQFAEFLTLFEGEPNFDNWLSTMTWSSLESHSSPINGHSAGATPQLDQMHTVSNSRVARSVVSESTVTNTGSANSLNSGLLANTPSSSHSSVFERACSSVQEPTPEPTPVRGLQRKLRKQGPRQTTEATPCDQQIGPRASRATSQLPERRSMKMVRKEARDTPLTTSPANSTQINIEANTIPSDLSVEYAFGCFSDAKEVFETFYKRLSDDRKHLSSLLMRLFYAVGSPDALRQLRDALDLSRKNSMIASYHDSNDLAATVSVLDQLDATTTLSHILRRYHLVRLLDHRSKLESNHKAAKLAVKGTKRRLKYDCERIELMRRGENADCDANTRSAKERLKYRSKTRALTDLMQTLYPDLSPDSEGITTAGGCEYTRKLTKLRNRLACARNWYQFEETFPGAILALIPCATGDLSISIDHVEKLPSDVLKIFLDYLKERRGVFLSKMSRILSKDLYDVLMRRNVTKRYKLEQTNENSLTDGLHDDDRLLELCETV